jgi:hypothetical protein
VLQKAVAVMHQLCSLAFCYGLFDILNDVVLAFLQVTQLTPSPFHDIAAESTAETDPTYEEFKLQKRRGRFLVTFSRHVRCQIGATAFFRIVNEFGDGLRASWSPVCLY